MNIKNLFKDASLTLITQIFTALSGVLIMLIISRKFGLESYGEYYIVKRVSDVLWLFFLFGMTVSIPRNKAFIDRTDKKGSAEFSILVFPALSILLFLFFSNLLMELFLKDLQGVLGLPVSILIVGMIFHTTIVSYLRAVSKFIILNIVTFINFSLIPLTIFFFTNDINSYINLYTIIILLFNFITYLILFSLIIRNHPFKDIKLKIFGFFDFLKYGILRLPGLFLASLIFTLPVTILNYLGSNKDIGALGQIFQLFSIISMPINALGIILLPNFSKIISEGNSSTLNIFLKKGIKFIFIISLGIALFLSVFIEDILHLINGDKVVLENILTVRILIIAVVPYSLYNFLRNPIDAAHKIPFSTILIFVSIMLSTLISYFIFTFSEISNFDLIIIFTTLNLLLLGVGSLFYTYKLYFRDRKV